MVKVTRNGNSIFVIIIDNYINFSPDREAYTLVRNRRFCIQPNKGFFAQLVEFEPIYRAQQTLQHGQSSNLNNSKKRKVDHLEQETESESELFTPFPPPPSPVSTCEVDNIMDVSLT